MVFIGRPYLAQSNLLEVSTAVYNSRRARIYCTYIYVLDV